jgi:hypothetical protein
MYRCSLILGLLLFSSCEKECQTCTQILAEHYFPNREGYPKTASAIYNSCGPNNDWIGEQVKIYRDSIGDTIYTKVLSTDCK